MKNIIKRLPKNISKAILTFQRRARALGCSEKHINQSVVSVLGTMFPILEGFLPKESFVKIYGLESSTNYRELISNVDDWSAQIVEKRWPEFFILSNLWAYMADILYDPERPHYYYGDEEKFIDPETVYLFNFDYHNNGYC